MTSTPHSHLPYGELGSGHYGNYQAAQAAQNITLVQDRIFQAVESIPVDRQNDSCVFTIGDYGTADGSVTLPILTELIRLVRRKHGDIPVQIIHEDQPSNDFNSVFKRVHGLIPDPPSYLKEFQKVFVMASGTSFYLQVIPDNTAHLILSFMSAHWLTKQATTYQNSLYRFPDCTAEERKLVNDQAAKDWETFLLLRARELKSGGVLVVSAPAEDPEKRLGGVPISGQGTFEGIQTIWRQMRDEGKITQEEFVNTNMISCTRTLEEVKAPFEDPGSAVYKAGLRLLHADLVLSPCVATKAWQDTLDRDGKDARASWAHMVTNQCRCWSNSTFIGGLADTRSEDEKEALVDELYSRLEHRAVTAGPTAFNNDILLTYVFAHKI